MPTASAVLRYRSAGPQQEQRVPTQRTAEVQTAPEDRKTFDEAAPEVVGAAAAAVAVAVEEFAVESAASAEAGTVVATHDDGLT
jgi:hypothetical protein